MVYTHLVSTVQIHHKVNAISIVHTWLLKSISTDFNVRQKQKLFKLFPTNLEECGGIDLFVSKNSVHDSSSTSADIFT